MRNKPKYYSREDKLHYLKLFYESGMSKSAFCRAHEIYNASVLNVWIKKYEKEASLVTLPSEEPLNPTDVMANRSKENYKDENAQLKKRIKELEKALAYSRIRKIDNDFYRTQRQRNVLQAIYTKFHQSNAADLMKLLDEVLPYLSTDMTNSQIMLLAAKCIPIMGSA